MGVFLDYYPPTVYQRYPIDPVCIVNATSRYEFDVTLRMHKMSVSIVTLPWIVVPHSQAYEPIETLPNVITARMKKSDPAALMNSHFPDNHSR